MNFGRFTENPTKLRTFCNFSWISNKKFRFYVIFTGFPTDHITRQSGSMRAKAYGSVLFSATKTASRPYFVMASAKPE